MTNVNDHERDRLFLTQVENAELVSPAGERLGRVQDLIARLGEAGYPRITGLKAHIARRDVFVPMDLVTHLVPGRAQLAGQTLNLGRFERRPGEVLLRQDVLDRRLIDVVAGRLVHANDLVLARIDGAWHLVGVDPNPRGILQRIIPGASRGERVRQAALLDWSSIQPFVGHVPSAGLLMPLGPLKRLHPAQIADLVEHSSHAQGEEIIDAVEADPELTADVFEELNPTHQGEFLRSRSDTEAAEVLSRMEPDDAADLLNELDQSRRLPVLDLMPTQQRHKLRALLQYHPSTAGGMMSPDYVSVVRGTSLAQGLERIRTDDKAPVPLQSTVFVTDQDGGFVGAISVVDLVRGDAASRIEDIETLVKASVEVSADLPDVALLMTDFNLTAVAVTTPTGTLLGAISVDDLLEAMVPEDWRRRAEAGSGG
ncbi:MAG: CBS domain-containing protein [Chloroflexota bacterium]|nr:CBS domain-containing protein [Chloroflexota bacterium]